MGQRILRARPLVATLAAVAAMGVLALVPSAEATGTVEGPAYPPPGGVTLGRSGDIGRAGGATFTFSALDMTLFQDLWWGARAGSVQLAMDGAVDAAAETLAYQGSTSNLAAGLWRFSGSAVLPNVGTYNTRFTVQVSGSSPMAAVTASSAGIDPAVGAVAVVPGDFSANLLFEVEATPGSWVPAKDFFDAARTSPDQDGDLVLSVNGGFWYILANDPPQASFTSSPADPRALQQVTFTSTSSDPDGSIVAQAWDLDNDGAFDDGTAATASRSFPEGGSYTVRLRVTDDGGATAIASQVVSVASCEQTKLRATARNAAGTVDNSLELPPGVPHPQTEPVVRQVNCEILYGTPI